MVVVHAYNPSTRGWRQRNQELKSNLYYIWNSRLALSHFKTLNEKKTKNKTKKKKNPHHNKQKIAAFAGEWTKNNTEMQEEKGWSWERPGD